MRRDEEGKTICDISMDYRLEKSKKTFLQDVNKVINFTKIERKLKKKYSPKARLDGAPAYPPIQLFKILLLQQWYNLSDYEVEELLIVRLDFIKFVGLSMDGEIPDHSTICRFRNKLLELNLYDKLFNEINNQLEDIGILVKSGVLVDATIVESSRRPRKTVKVMAEDRNEEELSEESSQTEIEYSSDTEAKWLKKGKKAYYGYKVHASVDSKDGFITGGHVTSANKSDTSEFKQVVEESNVESGMYVLADKGYDSKSNKEYLRARNIKDGIMEKAQKNKKLSEESKIRNSVISKVRYKIERTFGTLKQHYNFRRARYVGRRKVELEFFLKAMAHNIKKAVLLCAS
jgi:IS5 family transposase